MYERAVVSYFQCECVDNLKEFANIVDNGGVVIYPTDTVYGIGCDAKNEESILHLYSIKSRPLTKSLPILTCSIEEVSKVAHITPLAEKLIGLFWPGQLTIVLRAKSKTGLTEYTNSSTNNSVAIRIPGDQCILDMIKMTKSKLLVGTSANFSQNPACRDFGDLDPLLISKCDAILTTRTINILNGESTIVDISNEHSPQIIRSGSLPKDKIIAALSVNK